MFVSRKLIGIFLTLCFLATAFLPVSEGLATTYAGGIINADGVSFRAEPSGEGARLKKLSKGSIVDVLATNVNAQWHKVRYNGETGYVNRLYVDLMESRETDYQATVVNVKESVNVRSKASKSGDILGTAKPGESFVLKDDESSDGWYQIDYNGKTGFVSGDYLQIAPKANKKQLSSISVVGGTLSPFFSPDIYGYVVHADKSEVSISVTAPSGVKAAVGDSGKSTYTLSMPKHGSKTIRIKVGGKIRYTLYVVRNVVTVGTYNIKRGYNKTGTVNNLVEMGELIKYQQPDLMGIQEVYVNGNSSAEINNLYSLRTKHMSHTDFAKTIDYSGNSAYGIGILSAYDIISSSSTKIYSEGVEQRVLEKIVVSINGRKVSVYNTHLAYESAEIRAKQFEQIKKIMDKDSSKYKILFGDFNCKSTEFDILKGKYTVLNSTSTDFFGYDAVKINKNEIDNIIVSKNITVCNVRMIDKLLSDHRPVFAYLILD